MLGARESRGNLFIMHIVAPNQTSRDETRVAVIPATVKKLIDAGHTVSIESGAGEKAHHFDEQYEEAGAKIIKSDDPANVWGAGDVTVTLNPPTKAQADALKDGSVLIGTLQPLADVSLMKTIAGKNITAFSLEFLPRISRAQSMDVLSSQANIGGYKAVVMAADRCPKMYPMMTTAAGTIAPARVFIVGAGVAGLQAIATAKRLGAIVEAFDVRAATKEQVQSLGARFVELGGPKQDDKATGGYAKEQTEEERQKQVEMMAKHVAGADCVITTAAIFGKSPPLLIPKDMVTNMKAGSVIVDLAAAADHGRGNCELTKPGDIITTDNGVTIVGETNLPALVPVHASQMYSANMLSFFKEIVPETELKIDTEDELQTGAMITHEGKIVNQRVLEAMQ